MLRCERKGLYVFEQDLSDRFCNQSHRLAYRFGLARHAVNCWDHDDATVKAFENGINSIDFSAFIFVFIVS